MQLLLPAPCQLVLPLMMGLLQLLLVLPLMMALLKLLLVRLVAPPRWAHTRRSAAPGPA
jgi:hypothetical protein